MLLKLFRSGGDTRDSKCLAQQNIDRFVAAHNLQGNDRWFTFQHLAQLSDRLHAGAIHADDHIILMQSRLRGTKGISIDTVEKSSPAAQAGLHQDDVIIGVNRTRVQSIAELRKVLEPFPADDPIILMKPRLRGRAALLYGIDADAFGAVFKLPVA